MATKTASHTVLIDMDGLLLDTERISMRAFQKAAASFGLEMRQEDYVRIIGLRSEEIPAKLAEIYGPNVPCGEWFRRSASIYATLIENEPIPLMPGVLDLLDFLDEYHWNRAVATSTHTSQARFKLEKAGILKRVGTIVGGEQVVRGKPFPDIYLKAAERFDTPLEQIWVLEDSSAGLRAAAAAGMRPLMVPDLKPPSNEDRATAFAVLDSLSEFVRAMRNDVFKK